MYDGPSLFPHTSIADPPLIPRTSMTDPVPPPVPRTSITDLLPLTSRTSVVFNYLGRDFFNALSEKDAEAFTTQLFW